MKRILIIYPHFPPSNLAGVHRPRLFAQHLPSYGWEPVVLTVDEEFYEERLDHNLVKLLSPSLRVEKVKAFKTGPLRLVGDIGLRAFFQLYRKAKQLLQNEQFDFLLIPVPSFYTSLLGRWLNKTTGIKYGIDYVDPWVHRFPGSDKLFSRHWFSTKLAVLLEPVAVKNASLIIGVAEGYYTPVLARNPKLKVRTGAMPYGGEANDHSMIDQLNIEPFLFKKEEGKTNLVYAGAMLPRAYSILEMIFKAINKSPEQFKNIRFHFIGTGSKANDSGSYNIKPLAEKYGLWQSVVFEYPARIAYLDVLVHLNIADGVFILGSTEPHYTPSKTYQGVLSRKPLFAVLHKNSTAIEVIRDSGAGIVLSFNGEDDVQSIHDHFSSSFRKYMEFLKAFDSQNVNMDLFNTYSAKAVTGKLVQLLNEVTDND